MQEINSMDSRAEESSRETQLQQEIILITERKLKSTCPEYISTTKYYFLYLYFSVYPFIYQCLCQCGCLLVITFNFIIIIYKEINPMLESMGQNITLGTDTLNNQKSQENSSHKNENIIRWIIKYLFVHIYIHVQCCAVVESMLTSCTIYFCNWIQIWYDKPFAFKKAGTLKQKM